MNEGWIGVCELSPALMLRLTSFGELANWLDGLLGDTATFILSVGASLSVSAVIPYYTMMESQERPLNVSVSPDSEY